MKVTDANQRALQILRDALNLLETKGWTQKVDARDAHGKPVPCHSDEAACFCSIGAMLRASTPGTSPTDYDAYYAARDVLVHAAAEEVPGIDLRYFSVVSFNDSAGDFEPVRRAFQRAIKNLEESPAEGNMDAWQPCWAPCPTTLDSTKE